MYGNQKKVLSRWRARKCRISWAEWSVDESKETTMHGAKRTKGNDGGVRQAGASRAGSLRPPEKFPS